MKNKLVFAGLLISVLAIGFAMVGCDTGGGGGVGGGGSYTQQQTPTNEAAIAELLAGTWDGDGPSNSGATLVFSGNDQFQRTAPGAAAASGTYKFVKTGNTTGTLTFTGSANGVYTYTDTTQTPPYKMRLKKSTGTIIAETVTNWTKRATQSNELIIAGLDLNSYSGGTLVVAIVPNDVVSLPSQGDWVSAGIVPSISNETERISLLNLSDNSAWTGSGTFAVIVWITKNRVDVRKIKRDVAFPPTSPVTLQFSELSNYP